MRRLRNLHIFIAITPEMREAHLPRPSTSQVIESLGPSNEKGLSQCFRLRFNTKRLIRLYNGDDADQAVRFYARAVSDCR